MRIVVDTNRIISALITGGLTRQIIISKKIDFYSLDYVLEEVSKYKKYVISKSKLDQESIELLFSMVLENITLIPDNQVKKKMKEATKIMKDIDEKDAPILAAALSFPNEGLWTEDAHFDKQDKVVVWKTKNLMNYV